MKFRNKHEKYLFSYINSPDWEVYLHRFFPVGYFAHFLFYFNPHSLTLPPSSTLTVTIRYYYHEYRDRILMGKLCLRIFKLKLTILCQL